MFDFDLDSFVNEINDVDTDSTNETKPSQEVSNLDKTNEIEQDSTDSAMDAFLGELDKVDLNTDTDIKASANNIKKFVDTLKIQSQEDKEASKYLNLADEAARKAFETNDIAELGKSEMYLTKGLEKRKEQYIKNEYNNCQKQIKKCCDNIVKLKQDIENTSSYSDTAKTKKLELWKNARVAKNNVILWHNMQTTEIDAHQREMNDMGKRSADRFGFEYTPADFSDLKKLKLKLYNGITMSEINNILNNVLSK